MKIFFVVALVILTSGCFHHGNVIKEPTDQQAFVAIQAGTTSVPYHYVIDPKTQLCWLDRYGGGIALISCCSLRKIPAAEHYITWETDRTCSKQGSKNQ